MPDIEIHGDVRHSLTSGISGPWLAALVAIVVIGVVTPVAILAFELTNGDPNRGNVAAPQQPTATPDIATNQPPTATPIPNVVAALTPSPTRERKETVVPTPTSTRRPETPRPTSSPSPTPPVTTLPTATAPPTPESATPTPAPSPSPQWGIEWMGGGHVEAFEPIDENNIWIGLLGGGLVHTTNGGGSWTFDSSGGQIMDIEFYDDAHGWLVRGAYAWRTVDGGSTWEPAEYLASISGFKVAFASVDHGFLYGSRDVFESKDGGITFAPREDIRLRTGVLGNGILAIDFFDENLGFLVADKNGGALWRTDDAGKTWQVVVAENFGRDATLRLGDPSSGWALAGQSVWHTRDLGRTWTRVGPSASGTLTFLHQRNDRDVWLAKGGQIFRSVNGGLTWFAQTHGTESSSKLVGVAVGSTRGIAVTAAGELLTSSDAGNTWTQRDWDSPSADDFRPEHHDWCFDGGPCWVVAAGGLVRFAPTDLFGDWQSGEHWMTLPSGVAVDLNSVYFATPDIGWVGGDSGVILHTRDGGMSWRFQDSKLTSDIRSIGCSSNVELCVALAGNGTLQHLLISQNGGGIWYSIPLRENGFRNNLAYLFTTAMDLWIRVGFELDRGSPSPHSELVLRIRADFTSIGPTG